MILVLVLDGICSCVCHIVDVVNNVHKLGIVEGEVISCSVGLKQRIDDFSQLLSL